MKSIPASGLMALDIGAKKHDFAWECGDKKEAGSISSSLAPLRQFLAARIKRVGTLKVLMEATGIYYLDVALIAHELGAEVYVVNPKVSHHFAQALSQRNKTDRLDALMLLDFLKRMPTTRWTPPRNAVLELRFFGRYLTQLTKERTVTLNRLDALNHTQASPAVLRADLKRAATSLDKRIERIRAQAVALIKADAELEERFAALTTITGVAEISAVSILSELMVLPRTLNSRACVSQAGLDPVVHDSGTSVHRAARISKHGNKYLRAALFMPALSAIQHDPGAAALRQRLLDRGKKKIQADVAVMRKLLTAAWAIVRNPQPYDSAKLYFPVKNA